MTLQADAKVTVTIDAARAVRILQGLSKAHQNLLQKLDPLMRQAVGVNARLGSGVSSGTGAAGGAKPPDGLYGMVESLVKSQMARFLGLAAATGNLGSAGGVASTLAAKGVGSAIGSGLSAAGMTGGGAVGTGIGTTLLLAKSNVPEYLSGYLGNRGGVFDVAAFGRTLGKPLDWIEREVDALHTGIQYAGGVAQSAALLGYSDPSQVGAAAQQTFNAVQAFQRQESQKALYISRANAEQIGSGLPGLNGLDQLNVFYNFLTRSTVGSAGR